MILHKMGYKVFVLSEFPAYPTGKVTDIKYKGKLLYVENIEPFVVIRIRLFRIRYDGYLRHFVLFLNFVFLTVFYMPKILKIAGKIDTVYSLAPILFSSFSGFVYASITKCLFVYEASDLWPEELVVVKTYLSPLIMTIGKLVARLSYSVPDIIITVSGLAAEYISREYGPKASVYNIPIGVDPNRFPKCPKCQARNQLIRSKIFPSELGDKFIVLYAGLISTAQRVEFLAYVADKLREDGEIAILVVGEGERKKALESLRLNFKLNNLFILSAQPRNMMPTIISASDICTVLLAPEPIFDIALPSKFYEYLASCKPIIGACSGELRNIIESSNIGYAVSQDDPQDFADKIKQLKSYPDLVSTIEKNCHNALQKYSLENISKNFAMIFRDAMLNH